MNTWRDIKTAPVMQSIIATDGNHVYCGYIDNKAGEDVFIGYDLQEMEMEELFLFSIKGWQPALATSQPEKSADEMFRELGYKKAEENKDYIAYLKKDNWRTEIRLYRMTKRVKKSLYSHWGTFIGPEYLFSNEILACAQLIEEMEANNG